MAQGIFGGATNYNGQSLTYISKDIDFWINLARDTLSTFNKGINDLKRANFWNKIDFDFKCVLSNTPIYLETYLHDLNYIKESIKKDNITKREVTLLNKLGQDAVKLNGEYGTTYHNETRYWKDYGNPDFQIAENLYADGSDFFVTLQDATNASYRLEDYINESSSTINQHQINQNITNSPYVNAIAGSDIKNITQSNNELHDTFEQERKIVIEKINKLENLDHDLKEYINELLLDSSKSIQNSDNVKLDKSIGNLKAFLKGMGKNAIDILNILSSAATIASYLGL